MSGISFENVRKSFGADEVVSGIDLDIADGEFLVIVGPSGCGKSTCLRMIAGLEETSDGTISIGERVVNDLEPKDRDIAMVFQNYALYPHMTVYKNLAYGLKNQRMAKAEIKKRIDRVADILQLESGMLSRKPGALSGGQRQRVAMGRAIVREPQVFLFDEPLSNLDAKLRVRMRIEIQRLHKLLGITSVYVTHDQTEAMTLAQRLVVMNAGHIEQVGKPDSIYAHPDTLFVATFIGSPAMNLLNGSIRDGVFVTEGGAKWDVAGVAPDHRDAEADIVFGIRPEHLRCAEPDEAECMLTVDLVEDLGADELIYGRLEDDSELVVRARLPETADIGDTVPIRRSENATSHLFNAESGQRIN